MDVATPTAAIVNGFGAVRITASTRAGTRMFLGIAAQSDVDSWLAGTTHDELIDPYGAVPDRRNQREPGAVRAVTPPGTQRFWLATASGSNTVVLDWQATNGNFAVAPLGMGLLASLPCSSSSRSC
jgi:hypothetical protein